MISRFFCPTMLVFTSISLTLLYSPISAFLCVLHTCFSLSLLYPTAHSCYFLPLAGRGGSRCLARQLWGAHSENGESQLWFPGQKWRLFGMHCWDGFGRKGRTVGFQECSLHSAAHTASTFAREPLPALNACIPGLHPHPALGSWTTSRRRKMTKISSYL